MSTDAGVVPAPGMRAAVASPGRSGRGRDGGRRHAPDKAALLDGVAETVLAQLTVDSAGPTGAAQLRTVARDYRQLALAHPHAPLLPARPLTTPLALRPLSALRLLEDAPTLLTRAGFSGPDAPHIYRVLPGFLRPGRRVPAARMPALLAPGARERAGGEIGD